MKCEKKFKNLFVKRYHLCEQESKFACPLCDFMAITLDELYIHMEKNHTKKIEKCDYTTKDANNLVSHKQEKHFETIPNVEEMNQGETKETLENKPIQRYITNLVLEPFLCERCEQSFANLNNVNTHTCNPQPPVTRVKCYQCSYIAPDVHSLVSHLLQVHSVDVKMEECAKCDLVQSLNPCRINIVT